MASYKPAVGEVIRCSVYATAANQIGINSIHYRVSSVTTGGATLDAIADDFNTQMKTIWRAIMSSSALYLGVKVATIGVAGPPIPAIWSDEGFGTDGATLLPTQSSGILSLYTEVGGPAGRGRLYLPFPSTAALENDDTPTALYRSNMNDIGDAILLGFTGSGGGGSCVLQPVIYHRATNTATLITGYFSNDRFGTMRKRGQYGKTNAAAIG